MAKTKKEYRVPKTAITERGLKKLIKEAAKKHGGSLGAWAVENEILPQTVSAFFRKTQGAGLQIPEALGYRPQVVFMPLDAPLIAHMNPPRKPAKNPTKKVDHSLEPVEKKHTLPKDPRKETKKRLKAKKGK